MKRALLIAAIGKKGDGKGSRMGVKRGSWINILCRTRYRICKYACTWPCGSILGQRARFSELPPRLSRRFTAGISQIDFRPGRSLITRPPLLIRATARRLIAESDKIPISPDSETSFAESSRRLLNRFFLFFFFLVVDVDEGDGYSFRWNIKYTEVRKWLSKKMTALREAKRKKREKGKNEKKKRGNWIFERVIFINSYNGFFRRKFAFVVVYLLFNNHSFVVRNRPKCIRIRHRPTRITKTQLHRL